MVNRDSQLSRFSHFTFHAQITTRENTLYRPLLLEENFKISSCLLFSCNNGLFYFGAHEISKALTLFLFSQIYFRIHVSVLKLLFDKFPDVDVSVLEEHLQRASQGPFYHPEFDTETGQGTVYRSESTTSG